MFLYKLKPLKKKMLENNQLAISFDYNFNEKNITIIFFSLEQMILSLINNENKKFLSIEVYDDFSINTLFKEDDYKALIEILEIKFNKENFIELRDNVLPLLFGMLFLVFKHILRELFVE